MCHDELLLDVYGEAFLIKFSIFVLYWYWHMLNSVKIMATQTILRYTESKC